jgi:cytochrome c biogenesis protein CcmG/thiol:disulfide interchange protein DsbE
MNLSTLRQNTWRLSGLFTVGFVFWVLWKSLSIGHTATMTKVGKPFPDFALTEVMQPKKTIKLKDIKGEPTIVHIWATWCGICVKEHADWLAIEKKWKYPVVGVIYRDDATKARQLMNNKGNPFKYLLNDSAGKLGLDVGLTGTPETFVLDKNGIVRYHYIGAIDSDVFEGEVLPVLKKLEPKK